MIRCHTAKLGREQVRLLVLLFFAAVASRCDAQTKISVLEPDSPKLHFLKRVAPVYPPIAKAAHISGVVKLQVEVGVDGHVVALKTISGPGMLASAAQTCVHDWIYQPILDNGNAIPFTTTVSVSFDLPGPVSASDDKLASVFFTLHEQCVKLFVDRAPPSEQAHTCGKAARAVVLFPPQERFVERRSAYVYASSAYLRNDQSQLALLYANLAVAEILRGHDDGSGSSAAYEVKGRAEAQVGELVRADDAFSKAENFERDAITKMGGPSNSFVQHQYLPALKEMLGLHAHLLTALGRATEAAAKMAEAEKL